MKRFVSTMMMIPVMTSLLFFTAGLPIGTPAEATTFVQREVEESVEDAPIVVRGNARSSRTDWGTGRDGSRRIYTFTDFDVVEVLKGEAFVTRPVIQVRELGGEKDGVGMRIDGAARFRRDEDVVIFLSPTNEEGVFGMRGMMMGKFEVHRDENGDEVLRGPGIPSAGALPGDHIHANEGASHNDTSGGKKWTLQRLRDVIREQAARSGNAAPDPEKALESPDVVTGTVNNASDGMGDDGERAPHLHNSDLDAGEDRGRFSYIWLAGLAAVAAIAFVFVRLLMRR